MITPQMDAFIDILHRIFKLSISDYNKLKPLARRRILEFIEEKYDMWDVLPDKYKEELNDQSVKQEIYIELIKDKFNITWSEYIAKPSDEKILIYNTILEEAFDVTLSINDNPEMRQQTGIGIEDLPHSLAKEFEKESVRIDIFYHLLSNEYGINWDTFINQTILQRLIAYNKYLQYGVKGFKEMENDIRHAIQINEALELPITDHEAMRNILLMVRELHQLGYERIRYEQWFGQEYWIKIYPASHQTEIGIDQYEWVKNRADFRNKESLSAIHHSSSGNCYFEWDDCQNLSPKNMAQVFIARFPRIVKEGYGKDNEYKIWFNNIIDKISDKGFPYFEKRNIPNRYNNPDFIQVSLPPYIEE